MALNKKPYKGCRDFFPEEMRTRNFLFEKMNIVAKKFAFEPYDGPALEEVELYKAKSGEELINDQIYSFTDRGNREVAIRPEMTPTLARMVAQIHRQTPKPLRWYSIPNLMRYEKPQRGRVREHWQFNADVFGAKDNLGEVEILSLLVNFLKSFGATKAMFAVLVNDRRVVEAIFNDLLKIDAETSYKLFKIIDKSKKVSAEALDKMISEVLNSDQTKIFKSYIQIKSFDELTHFLKDNDIQESGKDLLKIKSICDELELSDYIQYDPTIVRGLDYYTGLVFEVFDLNPENRRAIAGGGAYANLLQIFNEPPLSGVGFGLGDVTLKDFLETHNLLQEFTFANNDLFVCYTQEDTEINALKLSNTLRAKDQRIELNLGAIKFNKIFKTAENKGHRFVAIIELKENEPTIQIKDLQNNIAKFFKSNEIEKIIEFIHKG